MDSLNSLRGATDPKTPVGKQVHRLKTPTLKSRLDRRHEGLKPVRSQPSSTPLRSRRFIDLSLKEVSATSDVERQNQVHVALTDIQNAIESLATATQEAERSTQVHPEAEEMLNRDLQSELESAYRAALIEGLKKLGASCELRNEPISTDGKANPFFKLKISFKGRESPEWAAAVITFIYGFNRIDGLSIANAPFTCLPQGISKLTRLKHLELSLSTPRLQTESADLPEDFANLINLRWAVFSDCPFEVIPDALLNLPAIESLSIKNAKLNSMNGLEKLKSLRFLALPNNRISTLPLEVVQSLTSLQFLSLRCNRIKTISQAVLDLLKQRRPSLNLDLNHIKDVKPIRALLGEKVEGLDSQRE